MWRNIIYVLNDRGSTTPLTLLRTLVPTVPNGGHSRSSEVFHEYFKKVEIAQQKIGRWAGLGTLRLFGKDCDFHHRGTDTAVSCRKQEEVVVHGPWAQVHSVKDSVEPRVLSVLLYSGQAGSHCLAGGRDRPPTLSQAFSPRSRTLGHRRWSSEGSTTESMSFVLSWSCPSQDLGIQLSLDSDRSLTHSFVLRLVRQILLLETLDPELVAKREVFGTEEW